MTFNSTDKSHRPALGILFSLLILMMGINPWGSFAQPVNSSNPNLASTDTTCRFKLKNIEITGNRKTKDYVILRELRYKKGDYAVAGNIFEKIQQSQQLLYNTNLFSIVDIRPVFDTTDEFSLQVKVTERWYIYPTPQFNLTDRNFNEWWKTYNGDLDRVVYGVKFIHYNLSGRADQLSIYALNGFSRNFYINYSNPYSNPSLTEGFSAGAGFSQYREYAYKSSHDNRLLFFKKNYFSKDNISAGGTYRKRKGFYSTHFYSLQLSKTKVDDSVITTAYNPNYFNNGKNNATLLDLSYAIQYVKTDNINYPLNGKVITASLSKRGLGWSGGINALSLEANYRKYFRHPANFYSSLQWSGRIKLPFKQAYINQRSMGYGDYYLNGLEYYVIDGVSSGLFKYTLSKKLLDRKIRLPFHIKNIPYLPFKIYAKSYANTGFVYNRKEFETKLNNRFLYTGGAGFDLLSLYDMRLSVEYSWNQLGEKGLFLHVRSIL